MHPDVSVESTLNSSSPFAAISLLLSQNIKRSGDTMHYFNTWWGIFKHERKPTAKQEFQKQEFKKLGSRLLVLSQRKKFSSRQSWPFEEKRNRSCIYLGWSRFPKVDCPSFIHELLPRRAEPVPRAQGYAGYWTAFGSEPLCIRTWTTSKGRRSAHRTPQTIGQTQEEERLLVLPS